MRIHIYKLKSNKAEILKQWGLKISDNISEAIASLREEQCAEESMRLFRVGGDYYVVAVMVAEQGKKLLEHNQNRPINKEHFAVLRECIESHVEQEKIYNIRSFEPDMEQATGSDFPIAPDEDFMPLIISMAKKNQKGLTFINLFDSVTISVRPEVADQIIDVCMLCNGHRSVGMIADELGDIPLNTVKSIVCLLRKYSLIVDSRDFYRLFHAYSRAPLIVGREISIAQIDKLKQSNASFAGGKTEIELTTFDSQFIRLAYARKSTRCFSGERLSFKALSGLLRSMYGRHTEHATIPSAGGFYPLRVYVVVLHNVERLEAGIYIYDHTREVLLSVDSDSGFSHQYVEFCTGTDAIHNANIVVFVSANLSTTTFKYANRGYRYLCMEAGHCSQNAYLFCAENNLGIVEIGGFNDDECSKLLHLSSEQAVLIGLIVGIPSSNPSPLASSAYISLDSVLTEELRKKRKIIRSLSSRAFRIGTYSMPYYVSTAKYVRSDSIEDMYATRTFGAYGIGKTLIEARCKAMVEAYERYGSSQYRTDFRASKVVLRQQQKDFFDQIDVAPQMQDYMDREGIRKHDDREDINWVVGYRYASKKEVFVPVEQVFYPLNEEKLGYIPNYRANSSGVAAHTDKDEAIKNALLELIERDAISVMWYSKIAPPVVTHTALHSDIQNRVIELKKHGRDVRFYDLTKDSVSVIMCIITGNKYPFTSVGAAARFNPEHACEKAFNEAELIMHSWAHIKRDRKEPDQVRSSTDHADLFTYLHIYEHDDTKWIAGGPVTDRLSYWDGNWEQLVKKFDPVVVDVAELKGVLYTERVFSSVLMPIAFGYGAEPYGHSRVSMLGLRWGWQYPAYPHLLA